MRKILVVSAALLLAVTSAQGAYVLSLESDGLSSKLVGEPSYAIDLMIESDGQPSVEFGDIGYMGAQTMMGALPTGWSVSGLTYNTVDFDSAQIVPGSALNNIMGIAADMAVSGEAGYTAKKVLLSFVLVAPTEGTLALSGPDTSVVDSWFDTLYTGVDVTLNPFVVTPEPATALLLIGALPFLRRRRA